MTESTYPLLLFDGVCHLCNGAVRAVIKRDPQGVVKFAPLQSNAASRALEEAGQSLEDQPDSMILVDERGVHTQSTAMIRLAGVLGFPYSLLRVFIVIPRPVRDWIYSVVARNRYRWFGRRDACMAPSDDVRDRFIGDEPAADPKPNESHCP